MDAAAEPVGLFMIERRSVGDGMTNFVWQESVQSCLADIKPCNTTTAETLPDEE